MLETCLSCGLQTKKTDEPVHKYLLSTPGCWAKFGQLLALEYQDLQYGRVHEISVDAYALQHPGEKSSQTINSAHIHLAGLYAYFKLGRNFDELDLIKREVAKHKQNFLWLEPPKNMERINVGTVLQASNATEHGVQVEKWAHYIFGKWEVHHSVIANMLQRFNV